MIAARFRFLLSAVTLMTAIGMGLLNAQADIIVGVDPAATSTTGGWNGYMNVFNLDRSGPLPAPTGFQFGSGWGTADLTAVFNSPTNTTLTLGPNTINDPDPYWYIGGAGGLGNKWMDANMYIQRDNDPVFSGQTVTFTGTVLSNSFTANHTARAFIRDFAPDFSTFNFTEVILSGPGVFNISLLTDGTAGRHVQYGFNVQGENVWSTNVGPFGTVVIGAVPEPSSALMLGVVGVGMLFRRRR